MHMSHWLRTLSVRPALRNHRSRKQRVNLSAEVFEARMLLSVDPIVMETSVPQFGGISGRVGRDLDADGVTDLSTEGENPGAEIGLPNVAVYVDFDLDGQLDQAVSTYHATDVPLDILDPSFDEPGTAISAIDISNVSGVITDINVTLDVTHTFRGDLVVTLVSPNGAEVVLASRVGSGSNDFAGTILDDQADATIAQANDNASGVYQPTELLSALNGQDPNGRWTLEIRDEAGGDIGVLTDWSLTIATDSGVGVEPQAVTDSEGNYSIDGLPAGGEFVVRLDLPAGFEQTSPGENEGITVFVTEGPNLDGVNFNARVLPGRIRGQNFDDLNGDGIRQGSEDRDGNGILDIEHGEDTNFNGVLDVGEPGRDGLEVHLIDPATDAVLQVQITRSIDLNEDGQIDPFRESGLYEFTNLVPGDYVVALAPQNEFVITAPSASQGGTGPTAIQSGTYTPTPPPTGTPEAPVQWLPDLISNMDSPQGMRSWFQDGNLLRFGQATPNVGHGQMRLVAGPDQGDGTQIVYQRIFDDQGGFTDRVSGLFSFHAEHNHIHFNDYAHYELRAAVEDGDDEDSHPDVGDVVRSGEKTSFCLVNVGVFDDSLPNYDIDGSEFGCGENQEISVGWEDIYGAFTEGQEINVAGLEPGQYWLEGVIDPDNHFLEVDETNNFGRVLVTIGSGSRVFHYTITEGSQLDGADFGVFEKVDLSGTVFDDAFGDGVQVEGELGLEGRAVFLDLNFDGVLNNPTSGDGVADGLAQEPWALTDAAGRFTFSNIEPGFTVVRLVQNEGEQLTTEPQIPTLISGQNIETLTFGIGIPEATLDVSLVNGVLTLRDIGENISNAMVIELGGLDSYLIRDNKGVFNLAEQGNLGLQLDPHTVVFPKSAVTSIVIETGDGDDSVIVIQTPINFSSIAHMIESPIALALTDPESGDGHDHGDGGHDDHGDGDHRDDVEHPSKDEFSGEVTVDFDINGDGVVDENDLVLVLATTQGSGLGEVSITELTLTKITVDLGAGVDQFANYAAVPSEVDGGDGNDFLAAFVTAATFRGGSGDDGLGGSPENDFLDGGSGDDSTFAFADTNITVTDFSLDGAGLGSDVLISIESATLVGGVSDNRLDASKFSGSAGLVGRGGSDTLIGGFGDDFLEGDDQQAFLGDPDDQSQPVGNDVLIGGPGDDGMTGNGGNDTFLWNEGDGSDGFKADPHGTSTVKFFLGDQADVVSLSEGEALEGDAPPVLLSRMNRNPFVAYIEGIQHFEVNLAGGNDKFDVVHSLDINVTVNGGAGHDSIGGSQGADVLNGDVGNDTISGKDGNDQVFGGSGTDLLFGGDGNDFVTGQSGDNDRVSGGEGDDSLLGGTGIGDTFFEELESIGVAETESIGVALRLHAMSAEGLGNDSHRGFERAHIIGTIGNDTLDASGFVDGPVMLVGLSGSDVLTGGPGNDSLDGGEGIDTLVDRGNGNFTLTNSTLTGRGTDQFSNMEGVSVEGSEAANRIDASAFTRGSVTLFGGGGRDTLIGSPQADLLVGEATDDEISFEANILPDDLLIGGRGDDVLQGGTGSDRFEWSMGDGFDRFEASFESHSTLHVTLNAAANHWQINRGREDLGLSSSDADGSHLTLVGVANISLDLAAGNDSFDASALADVPDVNVIVVAGEGNDIVTGGGGADVLDGGAGRDLLRGGAGNDLLKGGDQADSLDGGDGNDQVLGEGNSGDVLTGGRGHDSIDGGNGQDKLVESVTEFLEDEFSFLQSRVVITNSIFGQARDSFSFDEPGFEVVDLVTGIETAEITGSADGDDINAFGFTRGSVTLRGGDGDDTLTGSRGNDSLDGGAGEDRLNEFFEGNFTVSDGMAIGRGTDTLLSVEGAELIGSDNAAHVVDLTRFSGDAVVFTGSRNDRILGGTGRSLIGAGGGNDTITGGTGVEIVLLQIAANLQVTDTSAIGEGLDVLSKIDGVVAVGNASNNVLDASAFSGATILIGDDGDDRLLGGKGYVLAAGLDGTDSVVISHAAMTTNESIVIVNALFPAFELDALPTSGVDLIGVESVDLTLGSGNDSVTATGFEGSITIRGGGGNDTITGTANADSIEGGDGNDLILGLAGNDILLGGAGADSISAGDGNDTVIGNAGNNVLAGDGGADSVTGGTGDDVLAGASLPIFNVAAAGTQMDGNDTVNGDNGNDVLSGGFGDDQLFGGMGDDVLSGGLGNDNLVAGAGHDTLLGDGGRDSLAGAAGRDLIIGGDGDDFLNAGNDRDADRVDGGAGMNQFVTQGGDIAGVFTFDFDALLSRLLRLS